MVPMPPNSASKFYQSSLMMSMIKPCRSESSPNGMKAQSFFLITFALHSIDINIMFAYKYSLIISYKYPVFPNRVKTSTSHHLNLKC